MVEGLSTDSNNNNSNNENNNVNNNKFCNDANIGIDNNLNLSQNSQDSKIGSNTVSNESPDLKSDTKITQNKDASGNTHKSGDSCKNCHSKLNCNNTQMNFDPCQETTPYLRMDLRRRYRIAMYVFDWSFTVTAALVGGMLFYFVPVRGRLFTLDDHSISYPLVHELITFPALLGISLFLPIVTMIVTTIYHSKNWHDLHHSILGLIQAYGLTLLLVATIKCFIGGLRPNFLVRCNPTAESIAKATAVGFNKVYYSKEICTGEDSDVLDAMAAYPSGHAGLAACGLVFLALFLHARLKTFNNRGHLFIYVLILSCITGAVLVGVSRIVDYRHTFGNVIVGWLIGIICSLSTYRLNYLSLFGHDNHVSVAHYWVWYWSRFHNTEPQSSKMARHIADVNSNKQSYDV